MNNDFMDWIQSQVRGARNGFRRMRGEPTLEEEEAGKLISPIPDSMRMIPPRPDPNAIPEFETVEPSARKYMNIEGEAPMVQPTATPTPTATPEPPASNSLDEFNPEQYRVEGNFEIQPLPSELAEQVKETFGKEAGRAAVVMGTENPQYDPEATYENPGGRGTDVGLFQVNTNTLDDFLRRKPKKFEEIGVDDAEDLKDPIKNIKAAKIIMDEQGWNAWYGPRNKGYNVYDE